jgi:hypothetical protein
VTVGPPRGDSLMGPCMQTEAKSDSGAAARCIPRIGGNSWTDRRLEWVETGIWIVTGDNPKVDDQGFELAAEELPFELQRAQFVPANWIL